MIGLCTEFTLIVDIMNYFLTRIASFLTYDLESQPDLVVERKARLKKLALVYFFFFFHFSV